MDINSRSDDEAERDTRDTAQLTAPLVDTSVPLLGDGLLLGWLTDENVKLYGVLIVAAVVIAPRAFDASRLAGMAVLLLLAGGFALAFYADQTSDGRTTVKDRLGSAIEGTRVTRTLPWRRRASASS